MAKPHCVHFYMGFFPFLPQRNNRYRGSASRFDARNDLPRFLGLLERNRHLVNEVRSFPLDKAEAFHLTQQA